METKTESHGVPLAPPPYSEELQTADRSQYPINPSAPQAPPSYSESIGIPVTAQPTSTLYRTNNPNYQQGQVYTVPVAQLPVGTIVTNQCQECVVSNSNL